VRAFAVAYLRAVRDYERARTSGENVDAVAAAIAKYSRLDPALVAALLRGDRMTATSADGRVLTESIAYDLQWYRERGYVTQGLDVADLVDEQYAAYAASLLGP
jgi:hypothetical protein